jgi:hypothetical protein
MTQDILVNLGEEYYNDQVTGVSLDVGLYDDATDGLSDTSDVGDITTEPGNTNYARQTSTFSVFKNASGNYALQNDSQISFDFTDVADGDPEDVQVDTAFLVVNFQADETGDGSAQDHLLGTAGMSQARQTGSVDTIDYAAGDLTIELD